MLLIYSQSIPPTELIMYSERIQNEFFVCLFVAGHRNVVGWWKIKKRVKTCRKLESEKHYFNLPLSLLTFYVLKHAHLWLATLE